MKSKNSFLLLGFVILLLSYIKINDIINFSDNTNLNEFNVKNKDYKHISSSLPFEHIIKINDELLLCSGLDYPHIFITKEYLLNPIKNGSLYLFNTKKNELQSLNIENFPNSVSFYPHGMSLYKISTEKYYLYIINHSIKSNQEQNEERIEKCLLTINNPQKISLSFKNTITLPIDYFGTLNSIAVINHNTIYFTTHNYFPLPSFSYNDNNINSYIFKIKYKLYDLINILFQKLNIKKTYLYSYNLDEEKINLIYNSEGMSNHGLAYNSDKSILYMVRSFEKDIRIFEVSRNIPTKALLINTIKTIYNARNIYYDSDKEKIYVGIYGSNKELINMEKNYIEEGNFDDVTSFGGFEEIDVNNNYEITELILMKNEFKGVSSAIKIDNNIYLSSAYQNGLFIYHK